MKKALVKQLQRIQEGLISKYNIGSDLVPADSSSYAIWYNNNNTVTSPPSTQEAVPFNQATTKHQQIEDYKNQIRDFIWCGANTNVTHFVSGSHYIYLQEFVPVPAKEISPPKRPSPWENSGASDTPTPINKEVPWNGDSLYIHEQEKTLKAILIERISMLWTMEDIIYFAENIYDIIREERKKIEDKKRNTFQISVNTNLVTTLHKQIEYINSVIEMKTKLGVSVKEDEKRKEEILSLIKTETDMITSVSNPWEFVEYLNPENPDLEFVFETTVPPLKRDPLASLVDIVEETKEVSYKYEFLQALKALYNMHFLLKEDIHRNRSTALYNCHLAKNYEGFLDTEPCKILREHFGNDLLNPLIVTLFIYELEIENKLSHSIHKWIFDKRKNFYALH